MNELSFRPRRLLVTGGAGFIGSTLVDAALAHPDVGSGLERLVVLDALTYAGHLVNLARARRDPRVVFVHGDVCDPERVDALFAEHGVDAVAHLAAESHVDRSIEDASAFVRTNVLGAFTVLEVARRRWRGAPDPRRFLHVSTDEVYGALGASGCFDERSPIAPSSPYAASKAGGDMLARAFHHTYGFPVVTTTSGNNYGPRQLPEKLVPLAAVRAMHGAPIPVYGSGQQVRQWLHVEDHCDGLLRALLRGAPGARYNLGGRDERANLETVRLVADAVDVAMGRPPGTARARITHVADRPGHDFRYATDASRAARELGFAPARPFEEGIRATAAWYVANRPWLDEVTRGELSAKVTGRG